MKNNKFKFYLSLCAIIKNEGSYLLEWIEYHRMVGVEHFYFYDNVSTDNSKDILRYYIDQGIVSYVYWPQHPQQQVNAYIDCVENHKNDSYWIGFVDLDEFIVPLVTLTICEFLQAFEDTNGLGINWVVYGTSGHNVKPEGLQVENYLSHSDKYFLPNSYIKNITDPRKIVKIIDAHRFGFEDNSSVLDENLVAIGNNMSLTEQHNSNKIRINHYFTRSGQDIVAKLERGRATMNAHRRCVEIFYIHDRNEIKDPIMEKYIPELKQRVLKAENAVMRSNPQTRSLAAYEQSVYLSGDWNFYKFVIKYLTEELRIYSMLESGRNKLFRRSDFIETDKTYAPDSGILYQFDIKAFPWPIENKKYDLMLALDIEDRLDSRQKEIFLEIKRIAHMMMVSFKDHNYRLMENKVEEWTGNQNPIKKIRVGSRILYLISFDNGVSPEYFHAKRNVIPADFDWQQYVDNYQDLKEVRIDTKEKAEKHWMECGCFEKRSYRKLING